MFIDLGQPYQLAKGSPRKRASHVEARHRRAREIECPGVVATGQTQSRIVEPQQSEIVEAPEAGLLCQDAAMGGSGGEDDRVIVILEDGPAPPEPQADRDRMVRTGMVHLGEGGGKKSKPSLPLQPVRHGLDLGRDAKSVHIPERPDMPDESLAFHKRQGTPDGSALGSQRVENRLPADTGRMRGPDLRPDPAYQGRCGACGKADKITTRFESVAGMASGAKSPP